jgi:hypothetical protein
MTLAKFGIQYASRSNKQIKGFAGLRGIELPHCNDRNNRKIWIQALRRKGQEATITFLDFPPEIRNMVYGLLPHLERKDPSIDRVTCHGAILGTCKQVYGEAAGILFAVSNLPISVTLTSRYINIPEDNDLNRHYGVDLFVNWNQTARGQESDRNLANPWPSYLANVRFLRLLVHVQDPAGPWWNVDPERKEVGIVQANCALYDLYRTLAKSKILHQLHADISCALNFPYHLHYVLLSPICAASGEAQELTLKLTFRSSTLTKAIENASAGFRKIRGLEREIGLHVELENRSITQGKRAHITMRWSPQLVGLQDALDRCQFATSVRESDGMHRFTSEEQLAGAISYIEKRLDDAYDEMVRSRTVDESEKFKQLTNMRIVRKAEAQIPASN